MNRQFHGADAPSWCRAVWRQRGRPAQEGKVKKGRRGGGGTNWRAVRCEAHAWPSTRRVTPGGIWPPNEDARLTRPLLFEQRFPAVVVVARPRLRRKHVSCEVFFASSALGRRACAPLARPRSCFLSLRRPPINLARCKTWAPFATRFSPSVALKRASPCGGGVARPSSAAARRRSASCAFLAWPVLVGSGAGTASRARDSCGPPNGSSAKGCYIKSFRPPGARCM